MFPHTLKSLRESRGLNKRQMAQVFNMPYTTYNNYKVGTREPISDTLIVMAHEFNVTIDYLLGIEINRPIIAEKISSAQLEILQAYNNASFKDKNSVRHILDLPLIEEKREGKRLA